MVYNPDDPCCMVYIPTFTIKNAPDVGKYCTIQAKKTCTCSRIFLDES